ncbi:hypothetical protein O6H91_03G086000 [Diphasiastrum complanatum]|uniref:Uncharacterized protein n=1 Tax=Diphasiastrum complanatum TaxID=34168 RepID=A0ACC2E8Q4_DIPCM|nr:hypothetical protein O6H91_03G086000 [Diphasiastrum complanatum]
MAVHLHSCHLKRATDPDLADYSQPPLEAPSPLSSLSFNHQIPSPFWQQIPLPFPIVFADQPWRCPVCGNANGRCVERGCGFQKRFRSRNSAGSEAASAPFVCAACGCSLTGFCCWDAIVRREP